MENNPNKIKTIAIICGLALLMLVFYLVYKIKKKPIAPLDPDAVQAVKDNGKNLKAETKLDPAILQTDQEKINGVKQASGEFAEKINDKNKQYLANFCSAVNTETTGMGEYLGAIIALSPVPVSDKQLEGYFKLLDAASKRAEVAAASYFNASAEMLLAHGQNIKVNASCTQRTWKYIEVSQHTHTEWEKTVEKTTEHKTSGVVDFLIGYRGGSHTFSKETLKTDTRTRSVIPIQVCNEWNLTESMASNLQAAYTMTLAVNYAAFVKAVSLAPDPLKYFNVSKELLDTWAKAAYPENFE